jgi:hypothetical protein
MSSNQDSEKKLNELFSAYRQEMPDFDGGADFLPGMWAKIESKKSQTSIWFAWTKGILAGATCAGVLLVGFSVWSPFERSAYYETSYVEALDASEDVMVMAALHPASPVEQPTE